MTDYVLTHYDDMGDSYELEFYDLDSAIIMLRLKMQEYQDEPFLGEMEEPVLSRVADELEYNLDWSRFE